MDYNFEGLSVEEALKVITEIIDPKERRSHEKEKQLNEVEMALKVLLRKVRREHEFLERVVKEIKAGRMKNAF